MIQKTEVPEQKGLLDVLFGGKGDAAQAKEIAESGVDASSIGTEDFSATLNKAQDQKDAKTAAQAAQAAKAKAAARTKGESKQVATAEEIQEQGKAQAKKQGQAQGQEQVTAGAAAQAQAQAQALALAQAQAAAQAAAQAQGQAQGQAQAQTPGQTPAQSKGKAGAKGAVQGQTGPIVPGAAGLRAAAEEETAANTRGVRGGSKTSPLAGGVPGSGGRETGERAELDQAVIAAQQAAIASQRAAIGAQEATIKAHELAAKTQAQGAQGSVTLQPIVIQTPLAIPVEVLEVEEDDAEAGSDRGPAVGGSLASAGGQRPMVASQDFLAQFRAAASARAEGLESSRGEGRGGDGFSKSSHDEMGGDAFAMMVPSLGSHRAAPDSAVPIAAGGVSLQVSTTPSGRAEITDMVTLQRQVNNLAANGGGSVRVKVRPESLGEVTISVDNQAGKLNVRFEATSHEAREALASAMPELRQVLSTGRFNVGSLEVGGRASGGSIALVREAGGAGQGLSMSSWANQSQFSDGQGGGSQHSDGRQGGSAWERYFEQRDNRQQQREQRAAYQRYQEAMGT